MTTHTETELNLQRCAKHNCEAVPMESRDLDGNWHHWVTCKNIIEPCDSGMAYSKSQIHELWNLRQERQALLKDKGELETWVEKLETAIKFCSGSCGFNLTDDERPDCLNPTTEGQQDGK